jgi:hypothetical protein
MLALSEVELGMPAEARRSIATLQLPPEKRRYMAMFSALIELRAGRTPRVLPDLNPRDGDHVDTTTASALCLALGRRDDAIAWLKLNLRDPKERLGRRMLTLDPRLAPLRDDARFHALIS